MKTKLYKLAFLSLCLSLSSCLVDDDVASDEYGNGPNLVGFSDSSQSANALADGNTLDVMVPVILTGPTSGSVSGDLTVSFAVDAASTAVDGVHYELSESSVTLSSDDDFAANVPVTIITDGIVPPLEVAPELILNITTTTGDGIVVSGRTGQVTITINYLCFSNLGGDYTVNYTSGGQIHTVTEIADGEYEMSSMWGWPTSGYLVTFTDVCGNLTLINDWQFSNQIGGVGTVDIDSGNLLWTDTFVENVYDGSSWTMIKNN